MKIRSAVWAASLAWLNACSSSSSGNAAPPGSDATPGNDATSASDSAAGNDASDDAATNDAIDDAGDATTAPDVPVDDAPPNHPSACHGGTKGTWDDVTPPGLDLDGSFNTPAGANFGAHAFVIDPQDSATVYLGTSAQGIFKTTDCGATWVRIDKTGDVGKGRNGSFAIDPQDPNVLYTDGRYGPGGVFKSTNGGVDWVQVLPADIVSVFQGGMVEWIALDPTDHTHVVVSPHFTCTGTHAPNCLLESTNAGADWRVIDKTPPSQELGGHILLDRNTWLITESIDGGGGSGIWRTVDGGATWTKVRNGGAFPYLYKDAKGALYVPCNNDGICTSDDDGATWTILKGSTQSGTLAATSNALFLSVGLNTSYYASAPFTALGAWTALPKVPVTDGNGGWMIHGDPEHGFVYSSNFKGGFWRYNAP